jgi:hypothetical protein
MARVKNNVLTEGLSGKIGNKIVFRQRNGVTIAAQAPKQKVKLTENQLSQNKRFTDASTYAKNALSDPTLKAFYEAEAKKKGTLSARNAAMSDYLTPPTVTSIDASDYTGTKSNEKIIVHADDKFKISSLKLKIVSSSNSTIEEGNVTLSEGKWTYHTTALNPDLSGSKITISATDRPGNTTTKEFTL